MKLIRPIIVLIACIFSLASASAETKKDYCTDPANQVLITQVAQSIRAIDGDPTKDANQKKKELSQLKKQDGSEAYACATKAIKQKTPGGAGGAKGSAK